MIDRSFTSRDIRRLIACIDVVIEDIGETGYYLPVPYPRGQKTVGIRALENLRKKVQKGQT